MLNTRKNLSRLNKDILYLVTGFVLIFLALFPFWLFGEFSALGWYDEYDAIIPWYLVKSNMQNSHGFLHGYAGGTGGDFGFEWGNEYYSLYRYLLTTISVWKANLIFRFFGFAFLLSGMYFLCTKLHQINRLSAFAIAMFAVFVNYIQFGWTLGRHYVDGHYSFLSF
jgi:hypothetical protein